VSLSDSLCICYCNIFVHDNDVCLVSLTALDNNTLISLECCSRDACWIHVFRVLYSSVPRSDLQTVEILLEQIFSQTPLLCLQFIAVIEDASVFICGIIGTGAASVTLPIRRERAECTSREGNNDLSPDITSNESSGKSVIPPIESYPTHYELQGIPIISTKDIQLLLVCSRAINGGQRVEGEIQLPAMLFDCSDRPSKGALAVSNALLLVILCSLCLKEYIELLRIHTQSLNRNDAVSSPESHGEQEMSGSIAKQTGDEEKAKALHEFINRESTNSTVSLILSGSSFVVRRLLSSNYTGPYSDSSSNFPYPHHCKSSISQSSALSSSSVTATASASASSSLSHLQASTHPEEFSPEGITWMSAVKSTELVAACLYLSCCPHLVNRSVSLASDVTRTVRTARRKHEWESMGQHGEAPSLGQDAPAGSAVVAMILVATFESVSVCRPAILTSLLKGLLVCGDYSSHKHGISSRSHGQRKNTAQTQHSGDGDVQNLIVQFACAVFHSSLRRLCEKFPSAISDLTNVLDAYVPLLSLVPLPMLPATLFPIIRIAGYSAGSVLI
jgi:hypothetical protein